MRHGVINIHQWYPCPHLLKEHCHVTTVTPPPPSQWVPSQKSRHDPPWAGVCRPGPPPPPPAPSAPPPSYVTLHTPQATGGRGLQKKVEDRMCPESQLWENLGTKFEEVHIIWTVYDSSLQKLTLAMYNSLLSRRPSGHETQCQALDRALCYEFTGVRDKDPPWTCEGRSFPRMNLKTSFSSSSSRSRSVTAVLDTTDQSMLNYCNVNKRSTKHRIPWPRTFEHSKKFRAHSMTFDPGTWLLGEGLAAR